MSVSIDYQGIVSFVVLAVPRGYAIDSTHPATWMHHRLDSSYHVDAPSTHSVPSTRLPIDPDSRPTIKNFAPAPKFDTSPPNIYQCLTYEFGSIPPPMRPLFTVTQRRPLSLTMTRRPRSSIDAAVSIGKTTANST